MPKSVVDLHEIEPDIVQLTMQDCVSKNTFSEELIHGLAHSFEKINSNPNYKAVVLTGYANYFSSGGSQKTLLAMQNGHEIFTDANIYGLALHCPIPVISAMQGHAIGGGFVLGLASDFVILSRESVYTANFMKYGFTPGMGATYILPKKLGFSLAEELLLNGGSYRGAELEKRGVPFPVLFRKDVLEHAYQLARQLSQKPRLSLTTLKDHLVSPLRKRLHEVIEQEAVMHKKTFQQKEVKDRIIELYGR